MAWPWCMRSKARVDVFQGHGVGDHFVDFDFATKVLFDIFGELAAAFDAAKGGAAPDATGDELEGAGGRFLRRRRRRR